MKLNAYISGALFLVLLASTFIYGDFFINSSFTPLFGYLIIASIFITASGVILLFAKSEKMRPIDAVTLLILFLWAVYILINVYLHDSVALVQSYLLVSFCLFGSIVLLLSASFLTLQSFFTAVNIIAGIEAVICLCQYLGLLKSFNSYFLVTGTWVNPNVTAMFLAMSFPVILTAALLQKKNWQWLLCMVVIMVLFTLKCRTAFAGAITALLVILHHRYNLVRLFRNKSYKSYRFFFLTLFVIVFAGVSWYAYNTKKASAEGRQLIWKLSSGMVAQKPFLGYGYGKFEKNYNLSQAMYFGAGKGTANEISNATFVYMCYNEFLENTVQGGIVGLLFFVLLLISLLSTSFNRSKNLQEHHLPCIKTSTGIGSNEPMIYMAAYAGIAAFAVMGFFNFTIQAIPAMCLFVLYAAIISSGSWLRQPRRTVFFKIYPKVVSGCLLIMCGAYYFFSVVNSAKGHIQNKIAFQTASKGDFSGSIQILKSLEKVLSSSESYWYTFGKVLLANKQYKTALSKLDKAKSYSSHPRLFMASGNAYEAIGMLPEAKMEYTMAKNIEPNRLAPRYALMRLSIGANDSLNAVRIANEIMALDPKLISNEADFYKREALSVKDKYNSLNK